MLRGSPHAHTSPPRHTCLLLSDVSFPSSAELPVMRIRYRILYDSDHLLPEAPYRHHTSGIRSLWPPETSIETAHRCRGYLGRCAFSMDVSGVHRLRMP